MAEPESPFKKHMKGNFPTLEEENNWLWGQWEMLSTLVDFWGTKSRKLERQVEALKAQRKC